MEYIASQGDSGIVFNKMRSMMKRMDKMINGVTGGVASKVISKAKKGVIHKVAKVIDLTKSEKSSRGRPSKSVTREDDKVAKKIKSENAKTDAPDAPAKKPRGRPKKIVTPDFIL